MFAKGERNIAVLLSLFCVFYFLPFQQEGSFSSKRLFLGGNFLFPVYPGTNGAVYTIAESRFYLSFIYDNYEVKMKSTKNTEGDGLPTDSDINSEDQLEHDASYLLVTDVIGVLLLWDVYTVIATAS